MSDILIRNVPEKMKNKLKARAKEHHRSVSKEIYYLHLYHWLIRFIWSREPS